MWLISRTLALAQDTLWMVRGTWDSRIGNDSRIVLEPITNLEAQLRGLTIHTRKMDQSSTNAPGSISELFWSSSTEGPSACKISCPSIVTKSAQCLCPHQDMQVPGEQQVEPQQRHVLRYSSHTTDEWLLSSHALQVLLTATICTMVIIGISLIVFENSFGGYSERCQARSVNWDLTFRKQHNSHLQRLN